MKANSCVALLLCFLLGICFSDPAWASSLSPARALFFSNSDRFFRPPVDSHQEQVHEATMSPLALAAASAALLGLPSPTGTNAAVAKQVDDLLLPNPFFHTPLLVLLALRSSPPVPEDWLAGLDLSSTAQEGAQVQAQVQRLRRVQSRQVQAEHAEVLDALKFDLSTVKRENGAKLLVLPGAASQAGSVSLEDSKVLWDSASLGEGALGNQEGYRSTELLSALGHAGEKLLLDVAHVSRVVETAAASPSPSPSTPAAPAPAMVAASISLKALSGIDQDSAVEVLEAAVAVVANSILKTREASEPAVLVVVLDEAPAAAGEEEHHGPGLLLPWAEGSERRTLGETWKEGTDTPTETINQFVYVSALLLLLAGLIYGIWLMFAMPLTKDTLLYSGAKID